MGKLYEPGMYIVVSSKYIDVLLTKKKTYFSGTVLGYNTPEEVELARMLYPELFSVESTTFDKANIVSLAHHHHDLDMVYTNPYRYPNNFEYCWRTE